jgi:hypothetical protein
LSKTPSIPFDALTQIGPPAGGVGLAYDARRRAHGRVTRRPGPGGDMVGGGGRHVDDIRSDVKSDALFLHHLGNQAPRLVVEAAQDLRAAVELRHLHAQAVHDAGEFAGDVAAADDQQRLGSVSRLKMSSETIPR